MAGTQKQERKGEKERVRGREFVRSRPRSCPSVSEGAVSRHFISMLMRNQSPRDALARAPVRPPGLFPIGSGSGTGTTSLPLPSPCHAGALWDGAE